jgi:uncharacterized protein YlxW (UPF0749 family)
MPIWLVALKEWKYIAIGLLVTTNVLAVGAWQNAEHKLSDEKVAHKVDIATFKAAQKLADDNAKTERARIIKEAQENANKADANYATLLSHYRANLLRYKAHQGRTSQAADHKLPTPQSGDGTSTDADVPGSGIVITYEDAMICADNTARLKAVHDWAVNLPKQPE